MNNGIDITLTEYAYLLCRLINRWCETLPVGQSLAMQLLLLTTLIVQISKEIMQEI